MRDHRRPEEPRHYERLIADRQARLNAEPAKFGQRLRLHREASPGRSRSATRRSPS